MEESKNNLAKFAIMMKVHGVNCSVEITKDVIDVYFTAFKKFPLSEVEEAFSNVLYTWTYLKFPTVGVFLRAIESQQPSVEDRAEIQATEVLNQVRTVGSYGSPKFNDRITTWLIERRFPWSNLCSTMQESEEKWFIKDFIQAYRSVNNNKKDLLITDAPKKLTKITDNLFKDIEKEIGWTRTKQV